MINVAVYPAINFGAKLNKAQLQVILKWIQDDQDIELTTFQQLYISVPEEHYEEMKREFEKVNLHCYKNGAFVKSLRTCNFCQGAEEEGMHVAIEVNSRISGKAVPFTLKPAYTGCPNACGEPLVNDIGIVKRKETFEVYIGGKAKGLDAKPGVLLINNLTEQQLYQVVDHLVALYQAQGKKREPFSKFVNRIGVQTIEEQVGLHSY